MADVARTEQALVKVLDRTPAQKAIQTDKMTDTLLKVFARKHADRWKFISFRGPGGRDASGIVDTVAIRKNTSKPKAATLKSADLLELILIQSKGGSARRPSGRDIKRLQEVQKHHGAQDVVLFEWRKKKPRSKTGKPAIVFSVLRGDDWIATHASEIFGKSSRAG